MSVNSNASYVQFYTSLAAATTTPIVNAYMPVNNLKQVAYFVPHLNTLNTITIGSSLTTGSNIANFTLYRAKGNYNTPVAFGTTTFA